MPVIRRVGGLEVFTFRLVPQRNVIRRVGGLEVWDSDTLKEVSVIRRVGGLEDNLVNSY